MEFGGTMKSFLEFMKGNIEGETIVTKTFPMKKEWKTKMIEMDKARKIAEEAEGRADALRSSFWSMLELELNEFGSMRINRESEEIEAYEKKSTKSVKSPIQFKD